MDWIKPTLGLSALAAAAVLSSAPALATPVFFDLESDGAAGPALEMLGTFTDGGVTLNASATVGDLNSLSTSFGVDSPPSAGPGDDSDQIDAALGESITFEFVFTGLTVSIASLDFVGVGAADGGDAVLIALNGGPATLLETDVPGFSGTSDIFTPTTPIALSSGDTLTITAEETAGIEGIILNVIPEPATVALVGLGGLAALSRRQRA